MKNELGQGNKRSEVNQVPTSYEIGLPQAGPDSVPRIRVSGDLLIFPKSA